MSKVHFDPYASEDEVPDVAPCGTRGTWEGDRASTEYETSSSWLEVTCKNCLKSKKRLTLWSNGIESDIILRMKEISEMQHEKGG